MKSAGSTLLFFGIGSIVLYFLNMQFIILAWVDMWGETVGWAIRGAMIIVGAGLYFYDMFKHKGHAPLTPQPH